MSILKNLFHEDVYKYIKNNLELEIKLFEHYVFFCFEKINLIVEIKNKYYDILNKNKGYVLEDEKKYKPKNLLALNNRETDPSLHYFKSWTNRKLKRIDKILNLDIKTLSKAEINEKEITEICQKIIDYNSEKKIFQDLKMEFKSLQDILLKQMSYIHEVYPIKNWKLEIHQTLFPDDFMDLLRREINLVFGTDITTKNYNSYIGKLLVNYKKHNLPIESQLGKLLAIDHKKTNNLSKDFIKCYHARPKTNTKPLFPLNLEDKTTGFFVDKDKVEASNIIKNLYNIRETDIEIFELIMPKKLFLKSKQDFTDDTAFKNNASVANAYVFKPSNFSALNASYFKKLIKLIRVTG